jgi:hypothetical protein
MVQVRQFAHMPRPPFARYAPQPRSRLHSIQPFALAGTGVAQLGVKIRAPSSQGRSSARRLMPFGTLITSCDANQMLGCRFTMGRAHPVSPFRLG